MDKITSLARGRPARPHPPAILLALEIANLPAQAIAAYRPSLRPQRFVVVRQSAESHKASIYACSAAALELGVQPGMPVFAAHRKWPRQLTIVTRDEALERQLTAAVAAVFDNYTPRHDVIRSGIWVLDLTGTPVQRQLTWERIGCRIIADLRRQVPDVAAAVGLSRSRLIARILARRSTPAGLATCHPGSEEAFLDATELTEIPGLSAGAREKAHACGLRQVRQLRSLPRSALVKRFGRRDGERLYALAADAGTDGSELPLPRQKLQAETVLQRDVNDAGVLTACLRYTVDKLCHDLRRHFLLARGITFIVRYTDNRSSQSSLTLGRATDDFSALFEATSGLYCAAYRRRAAIKSMRLVATRTNSGAGQIDLFEQGAQRRQRSLGSAITAIRERQGFNAVLSAANIATVA